MRAHGGVYDCHPKNCISLHPEKPLCPLCVVPIPFVVLQDYAAIMLHIGHTPPFGILGGKNISHRVAHIGSFRIPPAVTHTLPLPPTGVVVANTNTSVSASLSSMS